MCVSMCMCKYTHLFVCVWVGGEGREKGRLGVEVTFLITSISRARRCIRHATGSISASFRTV